VPQTLNSAVRRGLFPDPVTGGGGSTDPSGGSQTSNPAGSGDQGSGTGQLGSGDVGNSPDIGVGNLPGAATGGADPLNNPLAPSQQLTLQLQAANVDVLVPENGFWGADLGITYQVTDQNGNPQNLEGAIPVELLAVTSQDGSMGQNMTNNYPNSCVVKNCGSTDANGQYLDSPVGTVKPQYFQSETFTQTTFLWDGTKGSWPGTQVSRTTWTTIPNPSIMGPNGGVIIGQGSIRNSWSYGP